MQKFFIMGSKDTLKNGLVRKRISLKGLSGEIKPVSKMGSVDRYSFKDTTPAFISYFGGTLVLSRLKQ